MSGEILIATLILLPFIIWILPVILISTSSRASPRERLAWVLLVVFISWFSWALYLIFAPVRKEDGDQPEDTFR